MSKQHEAAPSPTVRPLKPLTFRSVWLKLGTYPGYPKSFVALACVLFMVCSAIWTERQNRMMAVPQELLNRGISVPNYYHVWFSHELVFVNHRGGRLTGFGEQVKEYQNNWQEICRMDADHDGMTNGEELGDPCCLWKPQAEDTFSLKQHREYRRWNISHPSKRDNRTAFRNRPVKCHEAEYDDVAYHEQFRKFYFDRWQGYTPEKIVPAKIAGFLVLAALLVYWAMYKGLLGDLAPWLQRSPALSTPTSLGICVASWIYCDLVSGVVHLILDYAPHWIPALGGLARGFQYHHADPTAIIRISWYAYVSHIHLLCPLVAVLLFLIDASRVQRLFWFWGSVNCHLFQTAHRWAHFPPEGLNWIVLKLMDSGLLLTHEKHMQHHEDLEKQFTILSGHTDLVLDSLSRIVPPQRYDLWLFIGVIWFISPMALDAHFRQFFESFDKSIGKSVKVVDSSYVEAPGPKDVAV